MAKTKSQNMTIVMVAVIIAAILLGTGIFFLIRANQPTTKPATPSEPTELTDAERFKQSYESLNGAIREGTDHIYHDIEISSNNPIVYVDIKETLDLLKSDHAIIYVGGNWCPHCRNAVPVLLEVAKQFGLNKIYYLELDDTKSLFEWKDGELIKTRDGSAEYYQLLDALTDHLSDYSINDDQGKAQPTGEKRIYVPYVIAVKNGEIVGDYVGDVESEDLEDGQTAYDPLTTAQHDKLYGIYTDLFRAVYGASAKDECSEVCD